MGLDMALHASVGLQADRLVGVVAVVAQHAHTAIWPPPQLGSGASSGRSGRLWAVAALPGARPAH